LFEILHVVFKRWRLIAGLFAVVALSGLLAVLSRGPQFMARGTVMITSDRADVTIQPTEADSLALLKLNEAIVNSEVYVIRSRQLLEQVVRGLALARAGGNMMNIANAADNSERISERAVRILNRLKVTPIRNSNVIQIQFGPATRRRRRRWSTASSTSTSPTTRSCTRSRASAASTRSRARAAADPAAPRTA
jgi:uncharacterized protein involved in exopolysaccharide biosynthesis